MPQQRVSNEGSTIDGELVELTQRLLLFRDARNWNQFHTPKDLAVSVSIEAGELLEIFQWRRDTEEVGPDLQKSIGEEAADVLLYLLMLCDKAGVNLVEAAHRKIDLNEQRFPVANSFGVAKPVMVGK